MVRWCHGGRTSTLCWRSRPSEVGDASVLHQYAYLPGVAPVVVLVGRFLVNQELDELHFLQVFGLHVCQIRSVEVVIPAPVNSNEAVATPGVKVGYPANVVPRPNHG